MKFARVVYKMINGFLTSLMIFFMLLLGGYAVFVLWDNHQVYDDVQMLQVEMQKWKPDTGETQSASFEQLQAINPDVCGWVSMDGTKIDFPVLQGETNFAYLNTDVYGEFSLAGSIFLDSRNERTFSDPYNLLYGHHMAEGNMFGDLDLYKNGDFFEEHKTGKLILPDRSYHLEIYACLLVSSSDEVIFEPGLWQGDFNKIASDIENNALFIRKDMLVPGIQTLALSTCASEFTDARTIVLAQMVP